MTPEQATAFAARTLAAIDAHFAGKYALPYVEPHHAADRGRVASDLAGLRQHTEDHLGDCIRDQETWPCDDVHRYADGLRRTGALYGVTE